MLASKYADPQAAARKPASSPITTSPSTENKPLPPVPREDEAKSPASESPLIDISETKSPNEPRSQTTSSGPTPLAKASSTAQNSAVQDLTDLASSINREDRETLEAGTNSDQLPAGQQELEPSTSSANTPNAQEASGKVTPFNAPDRARTSPVKGEIIADTNRPIPSPIPDIVKRVASPANMGIKKRISRTGKPCIIRIPLGSVHEQRRYMPMTAGEVKAKLESLVQQGFSVDGFDQVHDDADSHEDKLLSEARILLNEALESSAEAPKLQVCIPDQRKWDAYVNQMTEEKLKALGVTTAADEPLPRSGSRADSPFGSLATSPPPLTSSAASQQMWRNSLPFSGPFSPRTATENTSLDAVASPVSSARQPLRPGHLSRQSTAGFPFSPSLAQDQIRAHSISPQFNSAGPLSARTQSPAIAAQMQRQPSALSKTSSDAYSDGRQQPSMPPGASQQPPIASSITTKSSNLLSGQSSVANTNQHSEQDEDSGRDQVPDQSSTPFKGDIAYPTPRGHRHNISENLEREAESAQYYPGEFVEEGTPSKAGPAQKQEERKSVSESQGANAQPRQPNGHQSKPSIASNTSSHLNVEAAEFKFGGSGPQSSKFTVPKNAFVPGLAAQNDPTKPHLSLLTAHANREATGGTDFNAAAPVFRPAPQGDFAFKSAFDFTAKGPSMNGARTEKKASIDSTNEQKSGSEQRPGLFSRILSDVIKPSKKSKAIPIVNPSTLEKKAEDQDEDEEDESGRPMQNQGRVKRGRMQAPDGDEVPQFAVPSSQPYVPPQRRNEQTNATPVQQAQPEEPIVEAPDPDDEAENPWHDLDFSAPPDKSLLREPSKTPPVPAKSPARASPAIREMQEPRSDSVKSPTYQEIDAIMDQLNQSDDQDKQASEAAPSISNFPSPPEAVANGVKPHVTRPVQYRYPSIQNMRSPRVPTDWLQEQLDLRTSQSPVRKLNHVDDAPVSDWDDMISASDENKFLPQAQFFDTRVKGLIESVIKQQLSPLQQHVKDVNSSVQKLSARDIGSQRPTSAYEKSSSDADDEDEDGTDADRSVQPRPMSHRSSKRIDQIKAAVTSAIENSPVKSNDAEVKARREAEQRAEELQKLFDISEKEIGIFKESTEELENKIKNFESERQASSQRISNLERIERELKGKTSDMSRELHALESTLNEYRSSSSKWRQEIDSVKQSREAMTTTIEQQRAEASESAKTQEAMTGKMVKMQETAAATADEFNKERDAWRAKDEQQSVEIAVLSSRMSEELRLRTKVEEEVERLGDAEKAAIRTNVTLEEMRNSNAHLTEDLARLRADNMNLQNAAALHEREAREAKDIARVEIQRNKTLLETDVEIANKKTESIRADLETRLQLTREELDRARDELEATSAGHKKALERANEARGTAIRQATEASQAAFAEERKRFEHSLRELSQQHDRALNGLSQEHDKAKRELAQHQDRAMRDLSERKDYEKRDIAQQKDRQMRELAQQKDRELREARQGSEQQTRTSREISEQKDRQMREVIQEADRTKQDALQDADRRVRDVIEKHKQDRHDRAEKHKQALRDQFDKHEQVLREAKEKHDQALREAGDRHEQALKDMIAKHEQHKEQLTEHREQALTELTQQHERSLRNAKEDKQRSEKHHAEKHEVSQERISNLEERNSHLLDRINHLEDKVTVAQSAAQAAATAAQQSAKTASGAKSEAARSASSSVSHPAPHDRVSPQALRESIVVLQEQLQERETRIERLESEMKQIDTEAPAKLSARETEIGWLRELLGVRVDDLSELVRTLSMDQAQFNRAVCRDAAIRIKANLQMEQQLKERLISSNAQGNGQVPSTPSGGKPSALPTLSDIQSFASPRAAQLAAAWGNWRKSGQSPSISGLREAMARPGSSASSTLVDANSMPSRNATVSSSGPTAQNFMSGLMTPPASNLRRTPSASSQKGSQAGEDEREGDDYDDDIDPDTRPLSMQLGDELDSAAGSAVSATSPIRSRMPASRPSDFSPQKVRTRQGSSTSRSRPKPQARPGVRETVRDSMSPPLMRKGSYFSNQNDQENAIEEDVVEGTAKATDLQPFGGVIGGEA